RLAIPCRLNKGCRQLTVSGPVPVGQRKLVVSGQLPHRTLVHEKVRPMPRQKVPIAVWTQLETGIVAVDRGEACPADSVGCRPTFELPHAVTPGFKDGIVQCQTAERPALRRLLCLR